MVINCTDNFNIRGNQMKKFVLLFLTNVTYITAMQQFTQQIPRSEEVLDFQQYQENLNEVEQLRLELESLNLLVTIKELKLARINERYHNLQPDVASCSIPRSPSIPDLQIFQKHLAEAERLTKELTSLRRFISYKRLVQANLMNS